MLTWFNHYKKVWVLVCCLMFMVFGGACITMDMWDKTNYDKQELVEETATYFMSKNTRLMVILGEKQHYVLNTPYHLKTIMKTPFAKHIKINFGRVTAYTHNNTAEGTMEISINKKNLSPAEIKQLEEWNFITTGKDNVHHAYYFYRGDYYDKGNFELPSHFQDHKDAQLKVVLKTKKNEVVKKALLTPVTLVADGVLAVVGIPLFLIVSIID